MKTKPVVALIAVAGVFLAGSVLAQVVTGTKLEVHTSPHSTIHVRPFCKFGLQFLASSGGGGSSVVQVIGLNGKPIQCAEDGK
jgi:hypothetical protein